MNRSDGSSSIVCSNCGQTGHVYRMCTRPVTSYGILCYRLVYDTRGNSIRPEYLMVQRKDSLGFVEFVRGKYDADDEKYIAALLSNMTVGERDMLLLNGGCMDVLWEYLWRDLSAGGTRRRGFSCKIEGAGTKDFEEAKQKFERVKDRLPVLLERYPSEIHETEWGFPKGRRNMNECDSDCAMREFQEETGLSAKGLRFASKHDKSIQGCCVEEMFQGSNGVWYKHVYFVAKAGPKLMQKCDKDGRYNHCNGEIRAVAWFSYEECLRRIRDAYPERRSVLDAINYAVLDAMRNASVSAITFHVPEDAREVRSSSPQDKDSVKNDKITFI